jgi:hypothetical protein
MAKMHNLAGQYCKSRAFREVDRYQAIALTMTLLTGVVMGFYVWPFLLHVPGVVAVFVRHGLATFFGVIGTSGIVLIWLMHRMKGPIESIWKERVKWLRGGQGEAYVALLLRDDLPDGWHIFNNIMIRDKYDIDHVVVGPRGLFAISTKAGRGFYSESEEGAIFFNGNPTEFLDEAVGLAVKLHDRLEAMTGKSIPFVQPILAAPLAYIGFPTRSRTAWVVHEDNMVEMLLTSEKRVSNAEVRRIVTALETCVT